MKKVYLCGEGAFDLGGLAGDRAYSSDRPGVIEALLHVKVQEGWTVGGGRQWKDIPKFRARPGETNEAQNVRGAALDATEAGCDVLVFVRDRDRDLERESRIEAVVAELRDNGSRIVGGTAHECIDAWVLAIDGRRQAHKLASSSAKSARIAVAATTEHAVQLIERLGLANLADDASSLVAWLAQAEAELGG